MIRIGPSIDPPPIGTPTSPAPRDDFHRLVAASGPSPAEATRSPDAINPLLLQEIATDRDRLSRDREARRRCETLLGMLRKLQLGLLGGQPAAAIMREAEDAAEPDPQAADPRLAGLLRAIRLRQQVEFAKLEAR